MNQWHRIKLPVSAETIAELKAGDRVLLSGTIYAARDAAHKCFIEALDRGEKPPVDLSAAAVYYMGPSPTRPGEVIGSCGPTTSARMDKYTPRLIEEGLRVMMGKGDRSPQVVEAIKKHGAVYLVTIGGAGALLSLRVKSAKAVAYPDFGAEAVLELEVEHFPAIVAVDAQGNDQFKIGQARYHAK